MDLALFVFRLQAAVYILLVFVFDIHPPQRLFKLFYYTDWTWSLLAAYFLITASCFLAQQLQVMCARTASSGCGGQELVEASRAGRQHLDIASSETSSLTEHRSWRDWMTKMLPELCCGMLSVLSCMAIFVPLCVWGVMFPFGGSASRAGLITYSNLNMHILVLPFMLVELMGNDVPARHSHAGLTYLIPALFGAFSVLRVASVPETQHCLFQHCGERDEGHFVWPYPFMDTSVWRAPFAYFALLLVHRGIFFLVVRGRLKLELARC